MGAEKHDDTMPFWPAAMERPMALAFTRVSDAQMRDWEKAGRVRFRRRGRNGALIALTDDLQAALRSLFDGDAAPDGPIEFDD